MMKRYFFWFLVGILLVWAMFRWWAGSRSPTH
jgi:hypothetical protein